MNFFGSSASASAAPTQGEVPVQGEVSVKEKSSFFPSFNFFATQTPEEKLKSTTDTCIKSLDSLSKDPKNISINDKITDIKTKINGVVPTTPTIIGGKAKKSKKSKGGKAKKAKKSKKNQKK
jgi:hypothetical protein